MSCIIICLVNRTAVISGSPPGKLTINILELFPKFFSFQGRLLFLKMILWTYSSKLIIFVLQKLFNFNSSLASDNFCLLL